MFGSQMFLFGGYGGGADFYALDTGILDETKLVRAGGLRTLLPYPLATPHGLCSQRTAPRFPQDREALKRRKRGGGGGPRDDSGNELIAWLEGLGLGKYTRVFIRQEVPAFSLPRSCQEPCWL